MTHRNNYSHSIDLINELISAEFNGISEILRFITDNAIKAKREQKLQPNDYEQTRDRLGNANRYKLKNGQN
jgi:hypothetical protein